MRLPALAVSLALCLALVSSGCGERRTREAWVDRNPAPEEPMTVTMDEPGTHGGRFVVGATSSPKTFNPIMANAGRRIEDLRSGDSRAHGHAGGRRV
ncbi:MAG: hypothetical protein RL721_1179 [Candidatus Eisenbacteria bacterium]